MRKKHQSRGRRPGAGTRVLDRQFGGIGRLQVRSGTHNRSVYDQLNQMLTSLYQFRRVDVLVALRDGVVEPLDVLAAYRQRGAADLQLRQRAIALKEAVDTWLKNVDLRPATVAGYKGALSLLLSEADKATTVDALPRLVASYKERANGARAFNLARAAALSFARHTLGKRDEVYKAIRDDVQPRRYQPKATTGVDVKKAREIAVAAGSIVGRMWWSMCTTGMRPTEYLSGDWEVQGKRVLIHGTKTGGAERIVPLVHTMVSPGYQYKKFREDLQKVAPDVTPRTARKSYAAWLEQAGIARTRRRRYLGHKRQDVTDIYEDFPVEQFLEEDRQTLRRYIGSVPRIQERTA
jgi:integrase